MRDHLARALADRYVIERELGRGGMASVWLAHDARHDRPVAIKVLHPELAAAIGVDRFVREIRLTARLQHPGIVPVLDSGVATIPGGAELPWYAMAYVAGESLRDRLDRERQLPVDEALRITDEAAAALHAAHLDGVIHRDIKPENLLLAGGRTWVSDFGIAKAVADLAGDRLTSTGLAIGTPAYMSPEQAAADPVDARSDQYSLAVVLYEMLTGEPPYTGPTAQAIMARRLSSPPRPIRPVRPSLPVQVEAAVLRALDQVPADRFPDTAAFAAALRAGPMPAASVSRRRPVVVRSAIAATAVVLVLAAGWLVGQRRRGPVPRAPEAVALYERGLQAFSRRTPESAREAIALFSAAIRLDSSWALPWAGLAEAYVQAYGRRFLHSGPDQDSIVRLAVRAADRALLLDRGSADAWVARAAVSRQVDPTDVGPPRAAYRRAIAIDSTHGRAWWGLGLTMLDEGDIIGGLDALRRSAAADGSNAEALAFLALGYYWRRQYDSAASWADSAAAVDPTYLLARTARAHIAIERGEYARARAAFDAGRRVSTDIEVVNTLAGAALVEARRGNPLEAARLLHEADSLAQAYVPTPVHTAVSLAQAHAALGGVDSAVDWLAVVSPRDGLHFQLHLRCDPPFDPLATEPRFTALLLHPRPPRGTGC